MTPYLSIAENVIFIPLFILIPHRYFYNHTFLFNVGELLVRLGNTEMRKDMRNSKYTEYRDNTKYRKDIWEIWILYVMNFGNTKVWKYTR